MKKLIPTLMLSAAAFCCVLAETASPKMLLDLYKAAYAPEKWQNIRSIKMIYLVTGAKMPATLLLIRAQVGGRVRLDIYDGKKHYAACRNGEKFWGYDSENGTGELTREEIQEMSYDIAFLPVPFLGLNLYRPLTQLPAKEDDKRIQYTTTPADGTPGKLTVSVNARTNLLGRVTIETNDAKYITSFRDYQNFDGAKLATRVQCSSPEGIVVMQLRNIEWNPSFSDTIYDMDSKKYDANLALIKENFDAITVLRTAKAVPAPKKIKPAGDAVKLQKEIAALDIQIKEKEERLKILEQLMRTDHADARNTARDAAKPRYRYRRTWYYGGWSGSYTTRYNHDQKRLAKKIRKEAVAAAEEYDKVGEELTKLRIRRSDAQIELQKLNPEKQNQPGQIQKKQNQKKAVSK